MVSEEVIVVCFDNSQWMTTTKMAPIFAAQLDAFKLYCRTKIQSNPKNSVGAVLMSSHYIRHFCHPTSDLDKILAYSKGVLRVGELDFKRGIEYGILYLGLTNKPNKPKRLLIFVGSPFTFGMLTVKNYGMALKKKNIAVDVVNFCAGEREMSVLEAFVGFVNNNDNSRIKHVQPGSSIRDVLTRTPAFITRVSIEEEDLAEAAAAAARKRTSRLSTKKKLISKAHKNQAPPPAHDEFVQPKRVPLKLVNKFEALSLENENFWPE